MEKETKYKEAKIWVSDNGYSIAFSDYRGGTPSKQGFKIAKTIKEVEKILEDNFIKLVD